ncbi:trypsin [Linepithema humile]|uniref:trypsin n=1 Tax=Linepithema humile TaxID=83485 RepID=UPI0006232C35|nr:PREDICTED: trypsin-like [Linepithema humile]
MTPKVIVFLALLAVAFAEKPFLGLRTPVFPHVVGGREAVKGSHPHIVSLQWGPSTSTASHFCAGSIIDKQWILTAAHCPLAVPSYGEFVVKAGKHNIKITESTEQVIRVSKSIVHENYQGGVGPYDIALIKLSTPLNLSIEVRTVVLPTPESTPLGNATLCGWGSTSTTSFPRMPDKLQEVSLPYLDLVACSDAVRRLTGSSPVHATNVCTGPLTGGTSACSGDSGGPLTSKVGNSEILTGIVSWGIIPCGTTGAPSVYTKVSKFNSWIQQKIATN